MSDDDSEQEQRHGGRRKSRGNAFVPEVPDLPGTDIIGDVSSGIEDIVDGVTPDPDGIEAALSETSLPDGEDLSVNVSTLPVGVSVDAEDAEAVVDAGNEAVDIAVETSGEAATVVVDGGGQAVEIVVEEGGEMAAEMVVGTLTLGLAE